jgi:hypothetical protein
MPRLARLAAVLVACGLVVAAAPPLEKRVYKVDSVIATRHGRTLTVEAKGAVQTGGWRKPRLKVLHGPDSRTLVVEFLAQPPPPGMTVIQALVPIRATLRLRLRRRVISVQAQAQANELTAQVLR